MNKNTDYWEKFYKEGTSKSLLENSDFSKFVLHYIQQKLSSMDSISEKTLLDIGCGNGKDTFYLRENGINSFGIDMNCDLEPPYFERKDALDISEAYDYYYMRFFLHTIEENQMDKLMDNILTIMKEDSYIFIETRSTLGITSEDKKETNFKSGIGEAHFRMLYSLDYLTNKFRNKFIIVNSEESKGLAIFKGMDPYIIRMVLRKK